MISIIVECELSKYNLDGKWNDFVGVQKEVISVLKAENYFAKDDIVNLESGMIIRLTPRGIKETIGKGNRFQNLPRVVKQQKIATLRALPQLLEEEKKSNSNHFYIHHIDMQKDSELLSPSKKTDNYEIQNL